MSQQEKFLTFGVDCKTHGNEQPIRTLKFTASGNGSVVISIPSHGDNLTVTLAISEFVHAAKLLDAYAQRQDPGRWPASA